VTVCDQVSRYPAIGGDCIPRHCFVLTSSANHGVQISVPGKTKYSVTLTGWSDHPWSRAPQERNFRLRFFLIGMERYVKTRVCKQCRRQRPIGKYRRNASMPCGFRRVCKDCEKALQAKKERREALVWDQRVNRISRLVREDPHGFAGV
jgi:hypothetical protein